MTSVTHPEECISFFSDKMGRNDDAVSTASWCTWSSREPLSSLPLSPPKAPEVSRNDDEISTTSGSSSDQLLSTSTPSKDSEASVAENSTAPSVTLANLPSLGSLGHFVGQCSKCCFFPKGRCLNGYDCRFCHFEHEKRQRKKKLVNCRPEAHYQMDCARVAPIDQGCAPRVVAPPVAMAPAAPHPYGMMPPHVAPAPLASGQPQAVECWPMERVLEWLTLSGLGHLSQSFEQHRITGDILLELSSSDLDEIGVHAVGDKKRFLRATSELRAPLLHTMPAPPPPPYPNPQAFMSNDSQRPCPPPLDAFRSPFSSPLPNPVYDFPAWSPCA